MRKLFEEQRVSDPRNRLPTGTLRSTRRCFQWVFAATSDKTPISFQMNLKTTTCKSNIMFFISSLSDLRCRTVQAAKAAPFAAASATCPAGKSHAFCPRQTKPAEPSAESATGDFQPINNRRRPLFPIN